MGSVVDFSEAKDRLRPEPDTRTDTTKAIQRVKASIQRINALLKELKDARAK